MRKCVVTVNELLIIKNIQNLWCVLSELFVDNEIDYQAIAIELSRYELIIIEFHLFYNVVPICSWNLEQMIPPVWMSFDTEELIKDISTHAIYHPSQANFKRKLQAKLYKLKYDTEWVKLKAYL